MNNKIVLPNNPIFFFQFILFPGVLVFIASKVGITINNTIETLGIPKIMLIVVAYLVFIFAMIFNSLVILSDDEIKGPGDTFNLFPVSHPLLGAKYSIENRRTGRITCECLIIRNPQNSTKAICLPSLYFTNEFFDEIINLIIEVNKSNKIPA